MHERCEGSVHERHEGWQAAHVPVASMYLPSAHLHSPGEVERVASGLQVRQSVAAGPEQVRHEEWQARQAPVYETMYDCCDTQVH